MAVFTRVLEGYGCELLEVPAIFASFDSHGYLPTPEQQRLGGYETWLGTNQVQQDASDILTDNLLKMLGELSKAK